MMSEKKNMVIDAGEARKILDYLYEHNSHPADVEVLMERLEALVQEDESKPLRIENPVHIRNGREFFESLIAQGSGSDLMLVSVRADEAGHASIYLSKEQWKDLRAKGDAIFGR